MAWAAGMGIISYRCTVKQKRPPMPGEMLAAPALLMPCALLAEHEASAKAGGLLAWGFDIAALMKILPEKVGGPTGKAAAKAARPSRKPSPRNPAPGPRPLSSPCGNRNSAPAWA